MLTNVNSQINMELSRHAACARWDLLLHGPEGLLWIIVL